MTHRVRLISVSVIFVVAALAAILAPRAQAVDGASDLELTKFDITRSTTQAGGHPDIGILFQMCGQGVPIETASNTAPIRITIAEPITLLPNASGMVRRAQGNTAANGFWRLSPVGTDGKTFDLLNSNGTAADTYVPGSAKLRAAEAVPGPTFGCTAQQSSGYLKDFTLHLPPGFLGNPTAKPPARTASGSRCHARRIHRRILLEPRHPDRIPDQHQRRRHEPRHKRRDVRARARQARDEGIPLRPDWPVSRGYLRALRGRSRPGLVGDQHPDKPRGLLRLCDRDQHGPLRSSSDMRQGPDQ